MEELKKLLQAIVISNAGTPMTVAQLNRDFKTHEGEEVPYRRFGFQQLDGMLRSMADVVQLNGQGSSALVLPVTTEKSQHIRAMIEKQKNQGKWLKTNPTHFSQSNRNEYMVNRIANTNYANKSSAEYNSIAPASHTLDEVKKIIKAIVTSNPGAMTVPGLNRFFKQHECVDIPYRQFGFPQLEVMLRSLSDIIQLNGQGTAALVLPAMKNSKSQHTGGTVGKRHTGNTRNTNSVNRPNQSSSSYEGNSCGPPARHENDGLRSCSSSGYSVEELKKMIQSMVISYAGTAMTVAQLNRDFKRHEGEEIPHRRFGFQQLDGLLRAMPDIVQLNGQGFSAFVSPVITQKSQHIREMIEKQKSNVRKSSSRPTYHAQNNRFDNTSNWHSNNTCWTCPDNNLSRGSMRNNSTPTDSEKFVMELIANYAKQFWY